MFLSHQNPSDGWAVVQLSVVETMGQVGVGAELLIPLRCSSILWLWFSSSSDGYLPACSPPLTRRKGKEEEGFCSVGWTTPAAATGCRADAFCLQSSLFRGRQASAKINQYSKNLWSALVFWVTSLSLMGSVMLRDVALHHTDVLSHQAIQPPTSFLTWVAALPFLTIFLRVFSKTVES